MKQSLGQKLNQLRKANGYTQDEIAARLGVTPQAVSKWENDQSCPDIMLLPELAKLYHVSVDYLFTDEKKEETPQEPTSQATSEPPPRRPAQQKNYDKLFLKVFVDSRHGDNVRVQVPIPVVQALLHIGVEIPELSALAGINLKQIDLKQIFTLIDSGVAGELVRVEVEGDTVRVAVEEL